MTTVREEEAREGNFPADTQVPESTADTRGYARASVPPAAPLPSRAVTERVRAVLPAVAKAMEFLDRPGSLMHAHPPTFARARELHHERAGRHNLWAPLRVARLAWGYFHLIVIKPALNFAEWVTETPLRLFGAAILALVVWHWS